MPDRFGRLVALATDDALRAFALARAPRPVRALAGALIAPPTRRLARDLVTFDDAIDRCGLRAAASDLLARLVPELEASGMERVPAEGPVLILANHPGLFDAIALLAALPREDLRIVAREHAFTAALPHLRERLIVVPAAGSRGEVVRAMANHLLAGGAVLTFPAGRIEADPAVRPVPAGAPATARSTDALARLVPNLATVRVVVSGVHTRRGLEHPLTRLRRDPDDRDWLGAVLQLLVPWLRTRRVRVDAHGAG
ncbi:1-acyl-sn-glycerol-3-phosphate acyltransferase [Propioniciclava soli]|uniref:1-acyl-sn-glycerol-3-phosphate acyltransferase n=1 Tax=Propioniciclava soli TaxID=2775081 RepID=UPI001E45899A|nr:1-acyl-sn-glycerol-3-phosphate acyltransferase [Propioniciclava soli]